MTEDEAKTKWCPHTRQGEKGNRIYTCGGDYTVGRCIGSGCMAWRWKWERQNNRMVKVGGWCGLAGRPQ